MGRGSEQQEVITTPEASGMRTIPSRRGETVDVGRLVARREVGMKKLRSIPFSRMDDPETYLTNKIDALTSADAARPLQMLQADSAYPKIPVQGQPLQMQIDFAGIDDTEWTPPNCRIAVGGEWLISTVNSAWAVFDRSGRQLLRRNFSDMFSSLVGDADVFSPGVVYDQFKDIWIMAACARSADKLKSWFLLAVSQSENPVGNWWIWKIDSSYDGRKRTGNWCDNLGLTVDNSSVYLTADMLNAHDRFQYAKIRILNKKDLYSGSILHGWDFWQLKNVDGTEAISLRPAINMKSTDIQYMLNITQDGQGLTQWTIRQPPRQAPTLKRKFLPTIPFQLAPNAKQQMSNFEIDTGDTSLGNVIFRHGQLWAAHTIAANWGEDTNVAAVHWVQINAPAGRVTNQGIFGSPHYYYFSPAVTVDSQGNMFIVLNRAGDPEFPTIRYTCKPAAVIDNSLLESRYLQQSPAPGETQWSCSCSIATSPDDTWIWMVGQYAATNKMWATWIGAITFSESGNNTALPHGNQPAYA